MYTMPKMDGDVPENGSEKTGAVSYDLKPTNNEKTMNSMKAPYSVKRITFGKSETNPGDTLQVRVPKRNKNEVLVPGSLALRFDIDLWRACQQLSRSERFAGACEPASS